MQLTINIDLSSNKALAFLNFIKTLDFIKVKEKETAEEFILSKEQKAIFDERKEKHLKGESKSFSWDEVKNKIRTSCK